MAIVASRRYFEPMDRALLLTARGLRAFGFGYAAVLLGIHLERRGLPPLGIGITLGVGLAAASLLGLASAWAASRIGRRGALAACGGLMALTGADLALSTSPALLALSGVTGMLGAASVDLGPFAAVEQAMLAEAAPVSRRSVAFGRCSVVGGVLNAAGGLAAILATPGSTAWFFGLYGALGVATAILPLLMSADVETRHAGVAFGSFRPLGYLAVLFAVDSLGGGFVANAVIAYWLHARFGASTVLLGPAFALIALLQSASYEVSSRLANRYGLINTMVFTHLPSNLLLLLVPFSPNLVIAMALLFARFALSQMDVPARQAYIVSIVP